MPPSVSLQERSLRAIYNGVPTLRDDVTAREAGPGIPVSRDHHVACTSTIAA